MDVDKLLNALDNESNSRLINMDTAQIENMKMDILKELELNDENYNDYLKKLKEYIYIDELNDLKEGGFIRWIQLNNDDIYLTQGGIFCETLITDEGIKKIVSFCPQLEQLNIWGCSKLTDKGLIHLRDLWKLNKLHAFGTSITWDGANKHRGVMQSMAANESLTIHVGGNKPTLYAFKMEELWKRTYQTNTYQGKLNPEYKIEIIK